MHTGKDPWDGMNMQQIMRAVSVDYRVPAVPETAPAHALLQRCFLRNPADRPSAGDLADAFAPPPTCSLAKDDSALVTELFEGLVAKFAKERMGSRDSSGSEKEEVDSGSDKDKEDKDKEDPSLAPWEMVFNRFNKFWRRLACIAALKTHNSDALVEVELEYFGPVIEDLHAANWVIKRPIQRILLEGVRVLGPAAIDRYDLNRTLIEP
jgi:serine/threonine protein kinase